MGDKPNKTKLKIILLADLILLALAIPSYFYVESVVPKPAEFQVENLTFDRTRVQVGEPVNISVNVTNIGDKSGNHSIVLVLNDEPTSAKTVHLSGSESKVIVFTATGTAEGNYTVNIGDLTGSFKATSEAPPEPAELQLKNLTIDRAEVGIEEPVTVSVMATNVGDIEGQFSLELFVNDTKRGTKDIQLTGGETKTVYFDIVEDSEGAYEVKLGNLSTSFTVSSDAQPIKPPEFKVSNLTITPSTVLPDEEVMISVNVGNVGEESGQFTVTLKINGATRDTKNVTVTGGATEIVVFKVTESNAGIYNVEITGKSASFTVESSTSASADVKLNRMFVSPYEVWEGETVTIRAKVDNLADEPSTLHVRVLLDGVAETTESFSLDAGATDISIEIPVTAEYGASDGQPEGYSVKLVNLGNKSNTVSGFFQVAPEGFHTLSINRAGGGSKPLTFTLDGESYDTPCTKLLPVGEYHISVPKVVDVGTGVVEFSHWGDGSESTSRTIILDKRLSLMAHYIVISGYASCPSLYFWNGTQYVYVTEVSNAGWLGYMDHINEEGEIVFGGGNPWDHVKLNRSQLQPRGTANHEQPSSSYSETGFFSSPQFPLMISITAGMSLLILYLLFVKTHQNLRKKSNKWTLALILLLIVQAVSILPFATKAFSSQKVKDQNEYYDTVLFQQWDELFYLDTAYLTVVDHPNNTDVYSTMVNYVNQGFYGKIYTVSNDDLSTPLSATNEEGEDVLPQISQLDGNFTTGKNGLLSPSWDNLTINQLTLNLGDLSNASEIKLVIHGMIDWGPPEPYYDWIDQFKYAFDEGLVPNGTQIYPPPYMEVMDANGNWKQIPQDRQMPIPADYVPRTFAVNLTGLFPKRIDDYKIRINNFWNVTFDYIGIDTTPQEKITIHEIYPTADLEPLNFGITTSNASGKFTKYGDVTPLLREADDKFVIGMQGDKVSLKFPTTDLPPLEEDMERSFFLFVASWFKDPPGNWGYGFEFTVEPLPFRNMSGFPYPPTESYPSTDEYTNYLEKWNTREINIP